MADVFDAEKRSDIMRQVKSKKNKSTELRLIEVFKENGITGWRRNYPVKGHPDFVFPKKKIAVFVDGCFWHGHDCRNTRPADHQEYWQKKRERNMKHDKEVILSGLRSKGIRGQDRDFSDIIDVNRAAIAVHDAEFRFTLSREWKTL